LGKFRSAKKKTSEGKKKGINFAKLKAEKGRVGVIP